MHFIVGEYSKSKHNSSGYFTLHEDGSLLYSEHLSSYSVYLGGNWRYELLVESETGKCVGYSSLLNEMPVSFKSIVLPIFEKGSLYFIENESFPLDKYSGCEYKPFTFNAYYDKEKSLLCIGELDAKGISVEFADNLIATVDGNTLKCLYINLENIDYKAILSFLSCTDKAEPNLKKTSIFLKFKRFFG